MLFISLDKLKLHKAYNYHTYTIEIDDTNYLSGTIGQMKVAAENALSEAFEVLPAIDSVYEVVIVGEGDATGEEAEDFVSAINIITRAFFSRILKNEGRARERRLDVPEKLKVLKANMSIIKEAVNSKTLIDNFNLVIKYKDLVFYLADERDLEETEFIHDIDELDVQEG